MKKWMILAVLPFLLCANTSEESQKEVRKTSCQSEDQIETHVPEEKKEHVEEKMMLSYVSMRNKAHGPVLAQEIPLPKEYGLHLEAGVIYEQMRISHGEIAVIHGSESTSRTDAYWTDPFSYDISQQLKFNMEPGVSAGVAVNFDNGWKLFALTQWLYSEAVYKNPPLNGTESIEPVGMPALFYITSDPATDVRSIAYSLSANLKVNYYFLDVALSRGAFWSKTFSYEPYAGVKTSWLYYNMGEYFNSFDAEGIPSDEFFVKRDFSSFWGVGPMVGINGKFIFYRGVSIFSTGNLAALFGQTRATAYIGNLEVTNTDNIPGYYRYHAVNNLVCSVIHTTIGLQYDQEPSDSASRVRLRVGFDVRYYFDQNPTVEYTANALASTTNTALDFLSGELEDGNFGMVGLLADVAIDF